MPNRSIKDTRTYGAPIGGDAGQSTVERPKVGPADPATVHRILADRANEKEAPIADAAPASAMTAQTNAARAPKDLAAYKDDNPTQDLSLGTAADRLRQRGVQLDTAINADTQ